jgi:hypothetical protein
MDRRLIKGTKDNEEYELGTKILPDINRAVYKEIGYRIEQGCYNDKLNRTLGIKCSSKEYNELPHEFFDHAWRLSKKGEAMVIGEPYGLSLEGMKRLIEFCEKHNLNCFISNVFPGLHYVNRTTPIVFCKKEKKEG